MVTLGKLELGRASAAAIGLGFVATLIPSELVRGLGGILLFVAFAFAFKMTVPARLVSALLALAFLSVPGMLLRGPTPTTAQASAKGGGATRAGRPAAATPERDAGRAAAPDKTSPTWPTIPGVHSGDVTASFTARGYACADMQVMSAGASWTCTKGDGLRFEMAGVGPTRIEYLTLSAMGMTAEEARRELQFLATVDFQGGLPDAARDWVAANIRKSANTTFGDVEFRLVIEGSGGSVRTLSIASPHSRYFR